MWFPSIFQKPGFSKKPDFSAHAKPRRGIRLSLEQLEDRTLLSSYSAATVADLIADINAANKASGTNIITLTAATNSPYVLTAVDNTEDGANGLPVIVNKDTLTIIGNGDTLERSAASPAFRLFDVDQNASLTLQNLTLQNGLAFGSGAASEGGAIHNQGTLVLSTVTVQGNIAQGCPVCIKNNGSPAAGGGIWCGSSLTLENGTLVENNQAIGGNGYRASQFTNGSRGGDAFGGGLYIASGTAYLTGISINTNIAWGGQGGCGCGYFEGPGPGNAFGGGLFVSTGTVNLSNDTIDDNQATSNGTYTGGFSYGGGLYLARGNVSLSGTTVDGNFAGGLPVRQLIGWSSRWAFGGGMYVAAGIMTLSNDTVQGNVAVAWDQAFGAGLYVHSQADISSAQVSGATTYIDPFTLAHFVSNTRYDPSYPSGTVDNIDETYILQIQGPYTRIPNC